MRHSRVRLAAIVVVVLGVLDLARPASAAATESANCFVCMPAVIQCPSYEEMNGECILNCGDNAQGGCTFYDPECGLDEVYVPCYS